MNNKPEFVNRSEEALEKYRELLHNLIGLTIQDVWIAWWLEHDEWLADEAVVFQFEKIQIEASFHQLSDFAVTLNTVNLNEPPNWLGCWEDMGLEWRKDAHKAIAKVKGRSVTNIAIIDYLFKTKTIQDKNNLENIGKVHQVWLLHALEFKFDDTSLILSNNLDENGLENGPLEGDDFRKFWIK